MTRKRALTVYVLKGHTGTVAELAKAMGINEANVRSQIRRARAAGEDVSPATPPITATMRREADVKEQVKTILRRLGAWYTMPHQAGFSQAGVPDFLICLRGRFIGLETKFGKNEPTAHQRRQLVTIRQAGGISLLVTEKNIGALESFLREATERLGA